MSAEIGNEREHAAGFVESYGRAWEAWDLAAFDDLFSDDVVYVAHATEETVVGRAALADYLRKEADDQGQASVRMGSPVIDGDHVAAEFWVTRTNEGAKWTTAGCFIARLGRDGRCDLFREYWFDTAGHTSAYDGWGE
jgi:ketosteroid isomerase-like protein